MLHRNMSFSILVKYNRERSLLQYITGFDTVLGNNISIIFDPAYMFTYNTLSEALPVKIYYNILPNIRK